MSLKLFRISLSNKAGEADVFFLTWNILSLKHWMKLLYKTKIQRENSTVHVSRSQPNLWKSGELHILLFEIVQRYMKKVER